MGRVGTPFSIVSSKVAARAALFLIGAIAAGSRAHANVGEAYGLGSRHGALVGIGASEMDTPFAAFTNPASLSREVDTQASGASTSTGTSNKRFWAGIGLIVMDPSFTPIDGVIVSNDFVSGQNSAPRSVDTNYQASIGQVVGLNYVVAPELWNLGVGVTSYLPLQQIAGFDSGEPFAPEYPLYRSRMQRSQFGVGIGVQPVRGVRFGAGFHVGYKLTGGTTLYVTTENGKPSSMRFVAETRPKASPYFGAMADLTESIRAGLTVRLPLATTGDFQIRSTARIVGEFDLAFSSGSTLIYDPLSVELGTSWKQSERSVTHVQLDFQRWSRYEIPAFEIRNPTASECDPACGLAVSPSINPTGSFRDIWVPRIGHELGVGERTTLRMGYGYRPSILGALPTGQGNLLDPGKHMFSVGAGFRLGDGSWSLDTHLAYHLLETVRVTKSGTEIGAPGYEAGGKILGGGVSLSLAL